MASSDGDGRLLIRSIAAFRGADTLRSAFELGISTASLVVLWLASVTLVQRGIWAGLALTVPAGAFLVRLFMIQHDCGHGAFFRSRRLNGWVGRSLGVLTLTPFEFWRRAHAHHHANTGNLDRRGIGDIDTLTLAEFRSLTGWGRFCYRAYRHPLVLFGIGPSFQFLLKHRLPFGMMRGWRPWVSAMGTNIVIALMAAALIFAVGPLAFFAVHLPVTLFAATVGVWLFYVQHQFEGATWRRGEGWSFVEAALHGSSYYDLPPVLRWFSANIGAHHIHHLCSTIPFYRLPKVLDALPELKSTGRLSLRESLGTTCLTLWDENTERMITFKEARTA